MIPWKQIYQVVIGKWYSAEIPGQYTRAESQVTLFFKQFDNFSTTRQFPA